MTDSTKPSDEPGFWGALQRADRLEEIEHLHREGFILGKSPVDWLIAEVKRLREAEAAAELRGKRAAFEEMARWCTEGIAAWEPTTLTTTPAACLKDVRTYCESRAREVGGEP